MAKLAAASAQAVAKQVSSRGPNICLHWSPVCELYDGCLVFSAPHVLLCVPFGLPLMLAVFQVQEFLYGLESGTFLQETKPIEAS